MNNSMDKVIDARLYVYTVQLLSASTDITKTLAFLRLLNAKVLTPQANSFYFTTRPNILNAILCYTYPLNIELGDIVKLAKLIIEPSNSSPEEGTGEEQVESFAIEEFSFGLPVMVANETSLLATAQDLLSDTNVQCLFFGRLVFDDSSDMLLLSFIQAKTVQLAKYIEDVSDIMPLYDNISSEEFQSWFAGVIFPFKYYYDHYGKVYKDTSLQDYLSTGDITEKKFNILIAPLSTGKVSNLETWVTNVIIPIIKYYDNDFHPLNEWLFYSDLGPTGKEINIVNKYSIWSSCISSLDQHFDLADFKLVIETFLASCYYFSFKEDSDTVSSIEIMNSYDLINKTLSLFSSKEEFCISEYIDFTKIPTSYSSLREFNSSGNPIWVLFQVNAILFLIKVVETCQKLFPINKLTIKKYLQFKYEPASIDTEREILRITSNINHSNWQQLIRSVNLFRANFFTEGNTRNEVSSIIIERLLFANLFNVVDQLFFEDTLEGITTNQIYSLIEEKFWDCLNHATNLNEKSGLLYNAHQCLDFFDKLVLRNDLDESNHRRIVKFKHLFKALHALKNFKIIVDRNQPFTPHVLIEKFADNVLNLVTIVLEQNPKSYLAFEKLYRILNDLLIFFDQGASDENQDTYYFNKLKTACIESALIDNNFNYAYTQSIELFKYFEGKMNDKRIEEFWLTFYQVGKYVSPQWFENPENTIDLEVLIKQREILSLTILTLHLGENSKIVINQWQVLNEKIQRNSLDNDINKMKQKFNNENSRANHSAQHLENIGSIANDIINDASKTTNNASEKISNLFVSGLGWAIGANQNQNQ